MWEAEEWGIVPFFTVKVRAETEEARARARAKVDFIGRVGRGELLSDEPRSDEL